MLTLLLAALLAQTPSASAAEPFPFDAQHAPLYERAFGIAQRGALEEALPLAQQLTREAADNPRAWRLLGRIEMLRSRPASAEPALQRALALGIDGKRRADVLAALGVMALQKQQTQAGREHLETALRFDPTEVQALFSLAALEAREGHLTSARGRLERLLQAQPELSDAHGLYAAVLAGLGDTDGAVREVERAQALGSREPYMEEILAAQRRARLTRLAWQLPLALAGLLALALGLLYGAGVGLSRLQLGQLNAETAHLMRGEQTTAERRVDRLYGAVLWANALLFYVSAPAMLVLTLATGGGLLYAMLQMPYISVQLLIIVLLLAIGGLVAVVRGLFAQPPAGPEQRELTEAEAPALFAALREVAEVASARPVQRVYLAAAPGIGVREQGGRLRVLLGRGERVLHLGLAALRGMSVGELKSILAHEYGHFSHGETRLTPLLARIEHSVLATAQALAELGASAKFTPVWWYLRVYHAVFLRVTAAHGRRRELLADRVSALAYGGDTFARALTRVVENGVTYRSALSVTAVAHHAGRVPTHLFHALDAAAQATPGALLQASAEEELSRVQEAYDTHPPPRERIARVSGIAAARPAEPEPAPGLFPTWEQLTAEVGREVVGDIRMYMADRVELPEPRELPASEEASLLFALAAYQGVLGLGERSPAEAAALLPHALAALEAALGPADAFVPISLQDGAELLTRAQQPAQARELLARALALLEASPGANERRLTDLREALAQPQAA